MSDLCSLIWCALIGIFRPRAALQAENLVLRHQLNVLRRKSPKRLAFGNVDRLVFTALYRVAPGVLDALKILKPQTVIRWHRAGFQAYWRWKSRARGGRPKTPADIRQLIRAMSIANPLWGAPRIHGELLKLGIDVGQTTVAKYMARGREPPSQGWKTFLRNPCRRHCIDGFVRSADNLVSAVVWISDLATFPPRACVAGCDRTPERPLDCPPTNRSLRLATAATVHRSRSGLRVWRCRHPAASRNGHTGSADCTALAMAKWIFGEAHRFDPTGVS
jgi:hypothetical protein